MKLNPGGKILFKPCLKKKNESRGWVFGLNGAFYVTKYNHCYLFTVNRFGTIFKWLEIEIYWKIGSIEFRKY